LYAFSDILKTGTTRQIQAHAVSIKLPVFTACFIA